MSRNGELSRAEIDRGWPYQVALPTMPSCIIGIYTGEIAGYVIEGHMPAHAIQRCLPEGLMRSVLPFQACLSARQEWKRHSRSL
jgi:hypothetical protein